MLPRGGIAIDGRSSPVIGRSFREAVLDCEPSTLELVMSAAMSAVRFDRFEADLRSRELRSGGSKVTLQDQPFRILELLLAAPGEIVTREELVAAIWPSGTFVDFDHGLNAATLPRGESFSRSGQSSPSCSSSLWQRRSSATRQQRRRSHLHGSIPLPFFRWPTYRKIRSRSSSPTE